MAIVLDINFLSNELMGIDTIESFLKKYNVKIVSINSIDNWMWDNEKEIGSLMQIAKVLNNCQIVIIKLKHPLMKDLGIFIEKVENLYLYTVWMNTEGYPMLDCDAITSENRKYFENIFSIVLKIRENNKNTFEAAAIGLETDIHYSKDILDMIQKSKNVLVWIFNQDVELNQKMAGYEIKRINGIKILEKINSNLTSLSTPQIPGNRPYKKAAGIGLVPKADNDCTDCGLCARQCPAQAISKENPKVTDSKKCISCMRCIAVCPQRARSVSKTLLAAGSMKLKKACSGYKENELFL